MSNRTRLALLSPEAVERICPGTQPNPVNFDAVVKRISEAGSFAPGPQLGAIFGVGFSVDRPISPQRITERNDSMAERVGFEPTVGLRLHLISSQARSTELRHLSAMASTLANRPKEAKSRLDPQGMDRLAALGVACYRARRSRGILSIREGPIGSRRPEKLEPTHWREMI